MNKLTPTNTSLKLSPLSITLIGVVSCSLFTQSAFADSNNNLDEQIQTLQSQIESLAEQMDNQSSASVNKTHIGGYGELHYNNLTTSEPGTADSDKKQLDFHRFVLFINHEFSDSIRFASEFEVEHAMAGTGYGGAVELEQAYIEIDISNKLTTQTGVLLAPIGILNETHEPNTFYGTERNPIEKNIIPTTWWNAGVALKGKIDNGFSYDLLVSEGLYATDGYSIRGARQKSSKALANNLAYTGRLKYTGTPGLELAVSARHESNLGQGQVANAGAATLLETHAIYSHSNATLKALYTQWDINGNAAKTANADKQYGFFIEPSLKVTEKLGLFTRYNQWNKTTDSSNEETQVDFGVNYWPIANVVFKADYQLYKKDQKNTDGFNLAIGYSF
ncbi:MAG: hypothetical protein ISEC1_P1413 [Thiomicrorhabdus sp.]|nr:MAG: hypothetical protein ISEC1_P1413 [Thiomicrorhabdus sp.]